MNEPLRVAQLVPSLRRTGPILMVRDLAHALEALGCEVVVYYFDDKPEVEFSCRTVHLTMSQSFHFDNFEIIHSHLLRPNAYVWRHCRKMRRSRRVTTLHNDVFDDLRFQYGRLTSAIFGRLWLYFLRAQQALIPLSENSVRYYRRFFPSDTPICAIANGRDVLPASRHDSLSERLLAWRSEGMRILGSCALLTRRKGLEQAIDALVDLPECCLVIIGDGPERERLEALAGARGVAERCLFAGFRDEADTYIAYFDLYLMPSRSEGLPLALLEAAARGIPLVCSDIPALKENFSDCALFFPLDDPKALVKTIHEGLSEKVSWGERAHERYRQYFTAEAMARRYLALYRRVLAQES